MGGDTAASAFYLFDLNGRLLSTYTGEQVASRKGRYRLDLRHLKSGLYMVKIIDIQGIAHQRKLIIKR